VARECGKPVILSLAIIIDHHGSILNQAMMPQRSTEPGKAALVDCDSASPSFVFMLPSREHLLEHPPRSISCHFPLIEYTFYINC